MFVLGPAAVGHAAPKPSEAELRAQLSDLNKKVDKLIEKYNATRVSLQRAQQAEQAAAARLTAAEEAYQVAQEQVRELAGLAYQTSGVGLTTLLMGGDINSAAVLEQIQAEQSAELAGFAAARDERKAAAENARRLTAEIRDQAAEVERQRKEAEKLIDEIKRKLEQLMPTAPGRRSNGTWAPELPTGSDHITPRTRFMRQQVAKNFKLPFVVGCYRVDNHGEHPLGRACDFMMSTGGVLPTPANRALGDALAAWVIKNGNKLGVKYVIWRQRIYNMSSPGWRMMNDRGSITQNHYDHVHVSMH